MSRRRVGKVEVQRYTFIISAVDRKCLSTCTLQLFCHRPTCPLLSLEGWLVWASQIISALLRGSNSDNPTGNRVLNFVYKRVYNGRPQHDCPPPDLSSKSVLPPRSSHLRFRSSKEKLGELKKCGYLIFYHILNCLKFSNFLTW